ncbi:MAG: hypothetical protein HY809_03445 [Nitrospirae bacterium]|nr:hypothetical protein [Nitrospirota bacterium]
MNPILKGVIQKSGIIILPAVLIAICFQWDKVPAGILAGAVFGILNLRGLVRSVERFILSKKMKAVMMLTSIFRLFGLFAVIFFLMYKKLVNPFGLLFGFTVVFFLILTEGLKAANREE